MYGEFTRGIKINIGVKSWMKRAMTITFFFLLSRILIFWIISSRLLPYSDNQLKLDNPILDPFIIYDSYNYAQIALKGYIEDRLTAFFPLFPLLVRGLVLLGVNVFWAGFLLANLFFILSLNLFDKLLEKRYFTNKSRNIILGTLVFFPSSFFFSAFYTESFFLFLSLSAFFLWEKKQRSWAYLVGGLAAVSRIVGIVIPIAFLLERVIAKKVDKKDILSSFFAGCIFLSYPIFLLLTKGNPFIFLQVQKPYYGRVTVPPFYSIIQDIIWTLEKINKNEIILVTFSITIFHFILFIIFILYIFTKFKTILNKGTIRWSEVIFTFGLTLFPLSSVLSHEHLKVATHGFMRYFLPIFPLFIFMGIYLEKLLSTFSQNIKRRILLYILVIFWTYFFMMVLLVLRNKGFVA